MAAWSTGCSDLVETVRFLLPVVVQRDSAHMLALDISDDGTSVHLTALCGVAAILYLSALARGIVAVLLQCRGVVEVVVLECCC